MTIVYSLDPLLFENNKVPRCTGILTGSVGPAIHQKIHFDSPKFYPLQKKEGEEREDMERARKREPGNLGRSRRGGEGGKGKGREREKILPDPF